MLKTEPQWQGQTPTLVPPPLTAVGDKVQDAALAKAIRGEQTPRMPWLKVRMPRFKHTDEEAAAILNELIDHDRIPPNAPATPSYPIHTAEHPANPQTLLAGRELTGGKGFSCVACHALKDYVPKQVALGARFRFVSVGRPAAARVLLPLDALAGCGSFPASKCPATNGRIPRCWTGSLTSNSPPSGTRCTTRTSPLPPIPPSSSNSGPCNRATARGSSATCSRSPHPTAKRKRCPAFAVGFPNGHSVLFDLDRGAVRVDHRRLRKATHAGEELVLGFGRGDGGGRDGGRAGCGAEWADTQLTNLQMTYYSANSDRVLLAYVMTFEVGTRRSPPIGSA